MEQYIVSARKYRPTTFQSVVGQHALTDTLRNAIRSGHLAHAYLFCGPRGVGKTTCARIFAKTINCLNPTPDHDACNECESCRAFNEQRSFNIHELDAASNNSVEDIRSLIDQVRIPPQTGKYSVYIIDEVHMLSQGAFNALLKTLEEPPSYVIFILATTEKHKVLPTILSRCQVYDFSRIGIRDIVEHLKYVAAQEGVDAPDEALSVVAQKADGGLRDALSIFDQLVAFSGEHITYERTIEVLNVLDSDYYFRLTDMALSMEVSQALLLIDEVLRKGFDAAHFVAGYMQHLRDLLVSKDAATVQLLETSDSIRERYAAQANQTPAAWIFRALEVMNECDINYRTARNKRLTVELSLIRLCRINQPKQSAQEQPVARQTTIVSGGAQPAASTAPPQPQTAVPKAAPQTTTQNTASTALPKLPSLPSLGTMPRTGSNTQVPTQKQETPPDLSKEAHNNPFTLDRLLDAWAGLAKIFADEARLKAIVTEYHPVMLNDTECELVLANPWQEKEFRKYGKRVMDYVRAQLGNENIRLHLKVGEYTPEQTAFTDEERYKQMLEKNPDIAYLKDKLNLTID